jgi:hypothetical protein
MQQYAGIYLLQNHSTCFGCPSHPSSGAHETVTAASGTGHIIWVATFLQRGLIWPPYLFPKLKKPLRGKRFRSIEEVSNAVT